MKDPHTIVLKPVITEKSTLATENDNAYTFQVASNSNRLEIKVAVETIWDVKVKKVNTLNQRGKRKRMGKNIGFTSGYKKAIVTLQPGYKIDVF